MKAHPSSVTTLFEIHDFQPVTVEPDGEVHLPEDRFFRLIVVVKGKGEIRVPGHQEELSRSMAFLLPEHMEARIRNRAGTELILQRIVFEMFERSAHIRETRTFSRVDVPPFAGLLRVASYARLQRCMRQIGKEERGALQASRKQALMHEIMEALAPKPEGQPRLLMPPSFELSVRYLRSEFDKPIQLRDLAQIAGIHPTYYSSLFKQKMGTTPIEYLTAVRMNRAKEMLMKTDEKVRDVARRVGYKDEFYFSRKFKEQFGIAPTVYIRQRTFRNVVPLSYAYTDHLFALGVIPSVARIDTGFHSIARQVPIPLDRTESWDSRREALLRVKPDMVICKENISRQARENVGDIAPVRVIPWLGKDLFGHLSEIAALVDREKAAAEWIRRHEYAVEQAREKVKAAIGGASVTICGVVGDQCRIYADRNMGHVFYRSLGLRAPERLQAVLDGRAPGTQVNWIGIPLEAVLDYPSEYLLLVARSQQEARLALRKLQSNPGWTAFPAVKFKQVHTLDWNQWVVYAPYAIDRQLNQAVDLITKSR